MTTTDLSKYKDLYVKTAYQYIDELEKALFTLKNNPGHKEALTEAHLSSHSLKSQSLVMGYQTTGMTCKIIEGTLIRVKESEIIMSKELLESLINTIEPLRSSIAAIDKTGKEQDMSLLTNALEDTVLHILG